MEIPVTTPDMAGQRIALLIAASEFDDSWLSRLPASAADLGALQRVLADPRIGRFTVLPPVLNESEARIRRRIDEFFSSAGANDLLLLYYSGHGLLDDHGRLYFAARDTAREAIASTAVAASFISDVMERSVCRRQTVILDCCHSGAFAKGAKSPLAAGVGTSSAFEGTGRGRAVLTATDNTQYAWSGEEIIGEPAHSTFTKHLVEGLESGAADLDGDGRITIEDLYGYVDDRVREETPKQRPKLFQIRHPGEMVIGWSAKASAQPPPADHPSRAARKPSPIESLSFPREVRPQAPGEIRIRFSPGVSFVRVAFRYDADRLDISGKDKIEDQEFEHHFSSSGLRKTRYDLKAKETGEGGKEQIDVNLFDEDGELLEEPRTAFVTIRPMNWWSSLWRKVFTSPAFMPAVIAAAVGAIISMTTVVGRLAIRQLTPPPTKAYARTITESFKTDSRGKLVDRNDWRISSPFARDTWQGKDVIWLSGPVTMFLPPERFDPEHGFRRPRTVLEDFTLTWEFKFDDERRENNTIGFLVRAQPDGRGWFQSGYRFQLQLRNGPPSRPGFQHFNLSMQELHGRPRGWRDFLPWGRQLDANTYGNGAGPFSEKESRSGESGNGPALDLASTDWYELQIQAKDDYLDFWVYVHQKDTPCREGVSLWLAFDRFYSVLSAGGTVGVQLEPGDKALLSQMSLVAPKQPDPQTGEKLPPCPQN